MEIRAEQRAECTQHVRRRSEQVDSEPSENGHIEVVRYLVEKGADIHAQNDYALIAASFIDHIEVVNYLKSLP